MKVVSRLLLSVALIGCGSKASAPADSNNSSAGRHPDAVVVAPASAIDARRPDVDASSSALDATASASANTVSCYRQGAPDATCTLPTHCCFSNYDANRNGECMTTACSWGTISCDGPEDCGSGERCCAHAMIDPDQGLMGYTLACQVDPCGPAPANEELCHPGTCSSGTCVTGHDTDLPRTLSICQ